MASTSAGSRRRSRSPSAATRPWRALTCCGRRGTCALGPFRQTRLGKSELVAYQASPRGGIVRVRVAGDRVTLGGKAVTVLRGELL